MKYFFLTILFISLNDIALSNTLVNDTIAYKKIDGVKMHLYITSPKDNIKQHPCLVFFHGGGWKSRNINQFEEYCLYFAERGYVCIRAEYRVQNEENSTPFQSLSDARSAIRYIRKNAEILSINPLKIAAGGGSAGGHLSAACATAQMYDDIDDDTSISCMPNALLLYNPVIDNSPAGYGFERIGTEYKNFSPLHNLYMGMPPTLFILGEDDNLIPVETAKYYQTSMKRLGDRCDLYLYQGVGHGFFNSSVYKPLIISITDKFLKSLEW